MGHKTNMHEWLCKVSVEAKIKATISAPNSMKSHLAASDLLWFINVPSLNLLPLTPRWILNEICMADARQQDVKEEAGGTVRKVSGSSHHRLEAWSHLKGCFRWTSPWRSESVRQTDVTDSSEEETQGWSALQEYFHIKIKINEYFTLNWKKISL